MYGCERAERMRTYELRGGQGRLWEIRGARGSSWELVGDRHLALEARELGAADARDDRLLGDC